MARIERHLIAWTLVLRVVLVALLPAAMPALAQPANAPPGSVCVTPTFWCPAVRPGPPSAPCSCQTAQGWVQGVLK